MTPSWPAADLQPAASRRRVGSFLTSVLRHLVRRQDRDHFFDPFQCFQGLLGPVALLAQSGHNGQLGAHDDVTA